MAKNVNTIKNSEPVEVQVKRAFLNGMTSTDTEKYLKITRDKLRVIIGQITPEDKKALTGKGLEDCVSKDAQNQIAELLRKGKTTKVISQQTRLPVRVINAISEARIAKVFEDLKQVKEKPVYQELTEITNTIPTTDTTPEIDITEDGITVTESEAEPETKKKTKEKREHVSDEMGELLFNEYATGKSRNAIAKEYGITAAKVRYAVNKYCKKHNISASKRTMFVHTSRPRVPHEGIWNNALDRDEIINIAELIMKGFSNVEIEAMTGVAALTISKIRCKRCYTIWTKEYNFPKGNLNHGVFTSRTMSKETFDEVIKLIFERKTDREIAEALGLAICSVNCIRNKRSFEKLTKDMEFPKPLDSKYRVECNLNPENPEEINEESDSPAPEMTGSMTMLTSDQEFAIEEEAREEEEEIEEEEYEYDHIGSKRYFMNITKAFAANAAAAVLIKDGTLITYAVDEVIENAIMRVIAMATVEEIKGSSLYLYGGEVSYEYLTNMIVCLGINEINLPKKEER